MLTGRPTRKDHKWCPFVFNKATRLSKSKLAILLFAAIGIVGGYKAITSYSVRHLSVRDRILDTAVDYECKLDGGCSFIARRIKRSRLERSNPNIPVTTIPDNCDNPERQCVDYDAKVVADCHGKPCGLDVGSDSGGVWSAESSDPTSN